MVKANMVMPWGDHTVEILYGYLDGPSMCSRTNSSRMEFSLWNRSSRGIRSISV